MSKQDNYSEEDEKNWVKRMTKQWESQ